MAQRYNYLLAMHFRYQMDFFKRKKIYDKWKKGKKKKIRCMKCWLLHMCLILWGFNNHINSYQILCGTSFECFSCWQWAKDTNTLLGTVPIGLVIGHQNPVCMSFFSHVSVIFQFCLFFLSVLFSSLSVPHCHFFSTSFFLSLCLCIAAL